MSQTGPISEIELHSRSEFTLERVRDGPAEAEALPTNHAISLPPCDGGLVAWRLLLTAFIFESLLWGFPLSFGVFQNYYSQLPQFRNNPYVSIIGTVASGITYIGAPIIIPLIKRFAKWRGTMVWFGWLLCLLGLVAGSFADRLEMLILTQGVLYGLGFTILYYPIISMVNEFWIQRRGMAYGILCASSGVSGVVFPFAIERLLSRYGYRTTLRIIAIALFVLTGPLIPTLRGRLPESETSIVSPTDWSFLKTKLFWTYMVSNMAMGLGYFFPSIYLPSYATSNGLSSLQSALLLAIMSVCQVVGQMTFGYLSDRQFPLDILIVSSSLIASVVSYTCWGFAHGFALLAMFAIVFGLFGAGYTALWGRMGTKVSAEPSAAFAAFGLLNLGKGIGNILAGPIGGALLHSVVAKDEYGTVRYKGIVLFTGTAMILSALVVVVGRIPLLTMSSGIGGPNSMLR